MGQTMAATKKNKPRKERRAEWSVKNARGGTQGRLAIREEERRTGPEGKLFAIVEVAIAKAMPLGAAMARKEQPHKGAVQRQRCQAKAHAIENKRDEPGQVLWTGVGGERKRGGER